MLPRRPTWPGLGRPLAQGPSEPASFGEDLDEPARPLDDTLPSTPVALSRAKDHAESTRPKLESGVRARPPVLTEEVVPARRDARWEKD